MNWLTDLKIDLNRWLWRRRLKNDAKILEKTISRANFMSQKTKKRLWVFKIDAADYRIYTKAEMKGALRSLGLQRAINMYQPNEYIIHITKKPE